MPERGVAAKRRDEILTFEEIEHLLTIAAGMGVRHVRLTGGEPLVRPGIAELVRMAASIDGIESVAMTTNGALLASLGPALADAGLARVNISLDTLDPDLYRHMTRGGRLEDALAGIDAALALGLAPVKVNTVVVRRLGQDVMALARLTLDRPLHVRFIEYMPVGASTGDAGPGWTTRDVVPSDGLRAHIAAQAHAEGLGTLVPVGEGDALAPEGWGPARVWRLPGASGTIGFISAQSEHFCAGCNRLRLTADGRLRPCLFSDREADVRAALRRGTDADVRDILTWALATKPASRADRVGTRRLMSQIGG